MISFSSSHFLTRGLPKIRVPRQTMCLLIAWLNPGELDPPLPPTKSASPKAYPLNEYALIIASNRDERYDRPTLPSQFFKKAGESEGRDLLGGWDATLGKEGGTWLALSLDRLKIGALVNIPEPKPKGTKGRGNLVTDFLQTTDTASQYCEKKGLTGPAAKEYPGFQFIALEGLKTVETASSEDATASTGNSNDATATCSSSYVVNWRLEYTSNQSKSFTASTKKRRDLSSDSWENLLEDVFVFSNSPVHAPLHKVGDVESRFRKEILAATEASVAAAELTPTYYRSGGAGMRRPGANKSKPKTRSFADRNGLGVRGGKSTFNSVPSSSVPVRIIMPPVEIVAITPADGGTLSIGKNGVEESQAMTDKETALLSALFRILSCQTEYVDDRELGNRVNPDLYKGFADMTGEEVVQKLSAVFNTTPVFGTRTQTVIMVKWDGTAVWKEKTMREPIDAKKPVWEERTFRIKF